MKRPPPPVRLMAKRVCWLLIEVARLDAEFAPTLESPNVGLATIFGSSNFRKTGPFVEGQCASLGSALEMQLQAPANRA
jgi:hypothetical protein